LSSLTELIRYYHLTNQIEEMVTYCLLAIEKHNNKGAMNLMNDYFGYNMTEMLKMISLNVLIRNEQTKYKCLVVKYISSAMKEFRFRPQSLASKILAYHFQMVTNLSDKELYQQIKKDNPLLIDYLSIHHPSEVKDKLSQFIVTWC